MRNMCLLFAAYIFDPVSSREIFTDMGRILIIGHLEFCGECRKKMEDVLDQLWGTTSSTKCSICGDRGKCHTGC
jgi:hypothetical protein